MSQGNQHLLAERDVEMSKLITVTIAAVLKDEQGRPFIVVREYVARIPMLVVSEYLAY